MRAAQVHLGKRLPSGERRAYDISEAQFHDLAFQFQGFTGAMLANLVNTAVILAGREGRTTIVHGDLTRVRGGARAHAWKTTPKIPEHTGYPATICHSC